MPITNKQRKKQTNKQAKHTQVNQSLIGKRSAIELPPRTGSVRFRPSNRNGLIKLDGFILTCEGKEEKKDEYQDVWYGMGDKKKKCNVLGRLLCGLRQQWKEIFTCDFFSQNVETIF